MKIIPAIDIRNGKCVRLIKGDYEQETIYSSDPIAMAKKWELQGAQMLHIVDLDGAKEGRVINGSIINKIIKSVKIPIQVGGGVRSFESIQESINSGVSKIILGTVVLEDYQLFKKIVKLYGEKIIVSLDTKNEILVKNGWKEKSGNDLIKTLQELEGIGVQTIIYTDTLRDGTLTEPNYEMIRSILNKSKINMIVAGGISSIDQIKQLKEMNVYGVIIGKSLYEKKINLKEAITIC